MKTRARRKHQYRATRKFHGNSQSQSSSVPFGVKVALLAAIGFLTVFYIEKIPPAAQALIRLSNGHQRENVPPIGAYYSNCDDARSAGVAPLYAGEPGFRSEMDGDGDGVACEPYYR